MYGTFTEVESNGKYFLEFIECSTDYRIQNTDRAQVHYKVTSKIRVILPFSAQQQGMCTVQYSMYVLFFKTKTHLNMISM